MSDGLLVVDSLRVQFGSFLAVDDVSFTLRAGELMGMIGPNGAGKTTTLRAAAGLQSPTTGAIRILGHDVFRDPTMVGRYLGFTPDTPAVYETLTVEQFLSYIARAYSIPRTLAEQRIDHWLEQLWIADKRKEKISTLSRGMRQRLGVARTLLPDPAVILLDEPAAGLDPAGRVQFRQLLAALRDQGKAMIVSSHILADLAEYCTHIGIMGHGRLVQFGTVATVAGGVDSTTDRYRVVLVHRVGDLDARLDMIPDLRCVSRDGDVLQVEVPSGREHAASLLASLVKVGLPVSEFRHMPPDLEQAYLRTGIRQVD